MESQWKTVLKHMENNMIIINRNYIVCKSLCETIIRFNKRCSFQSKTNRFSIVLEPAEICQNTSWVNWDSAKHLQTEEFDWSETEILPESARIFFH